MAAARRSLEIVPDDPDGHVALGLSLEVAARPEDAAQAVRAALHWLERAYRAGWRVADQLRTESVLRSLRTEERFRAVTDAMECDVAEQRARATEGT